MPGRSATVALGAGAAHFFREAHCRANSLPSLLGRTQQIFAQQRPVDVFLICLDDGVRFEAIATQDGFVAYVAAVAVKASFAVVRGHDVMVPVRATQRRGYFPASASAMPAAIGFAW